MYRIARAVVGSIVLNVIVAEQPPPVALMVVVPFLQGAVNVIVAPLDEDNLPGPVLVQFALPGEKFS